MQGNMEQRLTARLIKYWNLVRKDHPMPEIEHFNTEPIADIWKQCFMVSVDDYAGVKYKYDYVGEAIISAYGSDLTNQTVDSKSKHFPGVVMYKRLGEVVTEHQPREDNGYFVNEQGKLMKYRACFLPFGNDKKGLTHVIVGLSFRVF